MWGTSKSSESSEAQAAERAVSRDVGLPWRVYDWTPPGSEPSAAARIRGSYRFLVLWPNGQAGHTLL